MQTLKTAAIVVLLMTIIYGAYVSLTTPPEPLPPEVEGMLVMSEEGDFSIDAGLPDSLANLAPLDPPTGVAPSADSLAMGSDPLQLPAMSPQNTLSDQITPLPAVGVTGTLSDGSLTISGSPDATADPDAIAALQSSYPTTGQSFSLPSPQNLDVTFQTASSAIPSFPNVEADPGVAPQPDPQTEPQPSATDSQRQLNVGVTNAIRTADKQFAEDKLTEALATLSLFYDSPALSGEQRTDMLSRLDPLAREVIYSKRHLLEQAHRVGKNETLVQIAEQYAVPWQLLANINQVTDPVTILPGTELKVVRGPFRAEVNLDRQELTLFLGDLYAGRFPIGLGTDPAPKPGTYTIQDKQNARTYYDASGSPVPAGSPANPYGNVWLDLGGQLSIHGSPSTTSPTDKGCISLAADYADDLYGILTQGSSVTIRR